jgi:hypothetical protein
MRESCRFAPSRCFVMPTPNGMCPRHAFLMKELGEREATRKEYGLPCSQCEDRFFGDELADCDDCDMGDVCPACRQKGVCCKKMLEEAEDEEREATGRVRNIERALAAKGVES